MKNNTKEVVCKCGSIVNEFDKLYECPECKAKVWKISHGRKFNPKEVEDLLNGKTLVATGFKSQSGTFYDTKVALINDQLQLIFDEETKFTTICKCECGGDVHKIPKGYKCSSCEKVVWEKFVDKELKLSQIKQLFNGSVLYLKNLTSKRGNVFNAEIFFTGKELELNYLP